MIKPANTHPLNISDTLIYKCASCNDEGGISCDPPIDIDNKGNPLYPLGDINCPKCGGQL